MERVVVLCIEHLLTELNYFADDEALEGVVRTYEGVEVQDLRPISETILKFQKMTHQLEGSEKTKQRQEMRLMTS